MSSRRQPVSPPEKATPIPNAKSKSSKSSQLYLLLCLVSFSTVLLFVTTRSASSGSGVVVLTMTPPQQPNSSACPADILPFYVYPLPSKFNSALLSRCRSLNKYTDMCPYVTHSGLGQPLSSPHWYSTHQFLAEIIFHRRALRHPCRVLSPSLARLFYAPIYPGLYASSVFAQPNLTSRDSLALALSSHLTSQSPWGLHHGRDHFLVSGRTAWDFLRQNNNDLQHDFGANSLFNLPAIRNVSILTVERQPWDSSLRQHGIPYPSYFHPTSMASELVPWQNRVLSSARPHLFSFVGATRKGLEKAAVRDEIIRECARSDKCALLDCSGAGRVGLCYDPTRVIRVMEGSRFCLQAPGDSYTRRSTFDAFLAGCVPVFFSEHTAYSQYEWYLPAERDSYSVFIDAKSSSSSAVEGIEKALAGIPERRVREMREIIVRRILPKVTYLHPDGEGADSDDAVNVALRALSREIHQSTVGGVTPLR